MAKIYVASSWRNRAQLYVVRALRECGHRVYDFRNPTNGREPNTGFRWSDIDPGWEAWSAKQYREMLAHPVAERGFRADMDALEWADVCVLLLPCGRSAHLEAGWCAGRGKRVYVLTRNGEEPELMAKMCTGICINMAELIDAIGA